MTKQEIVSFFNTYRDLQDISKKILNKYIKARLTRSDIYRPKFKMIDFEESDPKVLSIIYYDNAYDCYDADSIKIPFEVILNDAVDDYIQNKVSEKQKLEEERDKRLKEQLLKQELKEYERLKKIFEQYENNY